MNTPAPHHPPEDPRPAAVAAWHTIARTSDPALLPDLLTDLLAEEIVFRSPAVHTPQVGVDTASAYLSAAVVALGPTLSYDREWHGADSAALEFHAEIDGLQVQGVDILRWDQEDRLVEFTVMIRPLKALHRVVELMGRQLESAR